MAHSLCPQCTPEYISDSGSAPRALYDYLVDMVKPDDAYFPDRPRELIEHGSRMFEVLKQNALSGFTRRECDMLLGENFLKYLECELA